MDRGYDPMAAPESLDDVEEARAVTAVRAARMAALTPEERIERVHALCQALARLAAAPRDCPGRARGSALDRADLEHLDS